MKNKEKLRPFDELIFYSIGKRRPEIMEEFLRLILNDDTLEFKGSSCKDITNVYGYDSTLAEFSTLTGNGGSMGLLTAEGTEPDAIANAFLYFVLIKEEYTADTMDYSLIPKMIIVVLMEKDVYEGKSPFYKLAWRDDKPGFEFDGVKYILVNGEYKADDPLGSYIHDFMCNDTDSMRIDSIKEFMKQEV